MTSATEHAETSSLLVHAPPRQKLPQTLPPPTSWPPLDPRLQSAVHCLTLAHPYAHLQICSLAALTSLPSTSSSTSISPRVARPTSTASVARVASATWAWPSTSSHTTTDSTCAPPLTPSPPHPLTLSPPTRIRPRPRGSLPARAPGPSPSPRLAGTRLKRTSRLRSNPSRPRSTRAFTLLVEGTWSGGAHAMMPQSEAEPSRTCVCAPTPKPQENAAVVSSGLVSATRSTLLPLFRLSLAILTVTGKEPTFCLHA